MYTQITLMTKVDEILKTCNFAQRGVKYFKHGTKLKHGYYKT